MAPQAYPLWVRVLAAGEPKGSERTWLVVGWERLTQDYTEFGWYPVAADPDGGKGINLGDLNADGEPLWTWKLIIRRSGG